MIAPLRWLAEGCGRGPVAGRAAFVAASSLSSQAVAARPPDRAGL